MCSNTLMGERLLHISMSAHLFRDCIQQQQAQSAVSKQSGSGVGSAAAADEYSAPRAQYASLQSLQLSGEGGVSIVRLVHLFPSLALLDQPASF